MLKKLQEFIENRYKKAEKYAKTYRDIEQWRGQAFGALEFCIDNKLINEDEAVKYWNEMWQKFTDLNYR